MVFALLGCVGSADVPTAELRLEARAEGSDAGDVAVYAPLSRGGSSVVIEEGDSLCAIAVDTREICRNKGSTGLLLALFAGGTDISPVTVELRRTEQESALGTTIEVPDPFTLTVPAEAAAGADVTVTWTPTGTDPMRYAIEGDCLDSLEGALDDLGTWTILANDLARTDGETTPCDVRIQVERYRAGTPDPLFQADSTAEGAQVRVGFVTIGG